MRNFTVITALLLCSLGWISVSGSESHTVDVQPGEEVTLLCSNFTSSPSMIIWYRVVKRSLPHCVCSMLKADGPASCCSGFKDGKFEMSSNSSTLFLKIRHVNSSDSGLYFCGYIVGRHPIIVSATYLDVQDTGVFDGATKLILGCLTVFLLSVVIGLSVKIKKLQRARVAELSPQQTEVKFTQQAERSAELNYAAVTFRPKTERNHRPATEGQEETAIYSATR